MIRTTAEGVTDEAFPPPGVFPVLRHQAEASRILIIRLHIKVVRIVYRRLWFTQQSQIVQDRHDPNYCGDTKLNTARNIWKIPKSSDPFEAWRYRQARHHQLCQLGKLVVFATWHRTDLRLHHQRLLTRWRRRVVNYWTNCLIQKNERKKKTKRRPLTEKSRMNLKWHHSNAADDLRHQSVGDDQDRTDGHLHHRNFPKGGQCPLQRRKRHRRHRLWVLINGRRWAKRVQIVPGWKSTRVVPWRRCHHHHHHHQEDLISTNKRNRIPKVGAVEWKVAKLFHQKRYHHRPRNQNQQGNCAIDFPNQIDISCREFRKQQAYKLYNI